MGFPSRCTQEFLPNLLAKLVSFLTLLKIFIQTILKQLGLTRFVEPEFNWPELRPEFKSISAALIQEMLPSAKFGSGFGLEQHESCAVCLYEFRVHDEIRRLINCKHVFHRGCVDRWMEQDQRSCPLCRTSFVPDHMVEVFNQRLEAASSSFPEFGSEFSIINTFL